MSYILDRKLSNTLQGLRIFLHAFKSFTRARTGSVWKAKSSRNEKVVIKVTNKQLHLESNSVISGEKVKVNENILSEKHILQHKLRSNHIVKYIDFFENNQSYHLVLEYAGKHSLYTFALRVHRYILKGHISIASWQELVRIIFSQMLEAIEHIHSQNVCHFDVSLQNFVINGVRLKYKKEWNGQETMHLCYNEAGVSVKLIDFGLAQCVDPRSSSTHYVGKLNYHCPKIFDRKPFDAMKNDVWCLGVCLFQLVTGLGVAICTYQVALIWTYMYCALGGSPYSKPTKSDSAFAAIIDGRTMELLRFWQKTDYVNDGILQIFNLIFQNEKNRANVKQIRGCSWLRFMKTKW